MRKDILFFYPYELKIVYEGGRAVFPGFGGGTPGERHGPLHFVHDCFSAWKLNGKILKITKLKQVKSS